MNRSLRRYTELPYLIDFLGTRELVLLNPATWDDRNDSYYIERFAKASGSKGIFALCLAQSAETYHHWRVFSSGSGGVCIEFNSDKLLLHLKKVHGLIARTVDYRTISELQSDPPRRADLPFLKRYAFVDEKEFRLFLATNESSDTVFRIKIPLTAIECIVLSPWLTPSVAEHVKMTLKLIEGCAKLRIRRSTLVENENWKKLAQDNA